MSASRGKGARLSGYGMRRKSRSRSRSLSMGKGARLSGYGRKRKSSSKKTRRRSRSRR
jgi:hypothetical protein